MSWLKNIRNMAKSIVRLPVTEIEKFINAFLNNSSEQTRNNFNLIVKDDYFGISQELFEKTTTNLDVEYLVLRIKSIDFKSDKLGTDYSYNESHIYNGFLFGFLKTLKWNKERPYEFLKLLFSLLIYRTKILTDVIEPTINSYYDALRRKRDHLIIEDDYGDYNFDDWERELENFYNNKIQFQLQQYVKDLLRNEKSLPEKAKIEEFVRIDSGYENSEPYHKMPLWIDRIINMKIDNYEMQNPHYLEYNESMSGEDYENFIKDLILNCGIKAQKTKSTGDQGVDIIVEIDKTKIAIQCKYYTSSKVGNDAVQQIYSAKDFFDCDICLVVTNTFFTKSAKQLATKLNVVLLHHDDLIPFLMK